MLKQAALPVLRVAQQPKSFKVGIKHNMLKQAALPVLRVAQQPKPFKVGIKHLNVVLVFVITYLHS